MTIPDTTPEAVRVRYTNWRGETSDRRLLLGALRFGTTDWHPEPTWLMLAFDVDHPAQIWKEFDLTKCDFTLAAENAAVRADNDRLRGAGWQTMQNAPKDGTIVDLWGINHLHHAKPGMRKCNVSWGAVTDWMGRERDDWRHGMGESFDPTHWMLPPAPPARAALDAKP
jgi:hypothetical protein